PQTTTPGASEPDAAKAAPVGAPSPLDLVPADVLFCWKGAPPPEPQADAAPSALGVGIRMLSHVFSDVLTPGQRLTIRLLEAFGEVIRYPFAIAVVDASAVPKRPGSVSVRLEQLKMALVIDTGGDHTRFAKIIQRILSETTDAGTARLDAKRAGGRPFQEFHDSRSPAWCQVAWGAIDRYFVVTLGEGVWPMIAAVADGERTAISREQWSAEFRARRQTPPLIEVILDADGLRRRLDAVTGDRASAFFAAWDASDLQRAYWTLGFEGRALYNEAAFLIDGRTVHRVYADPTVDDPEYVGTVPDNMRYAIYRISLDRFLPRLIGGIVATRGAKDQRATAEWWRRVQEQYGFDAERDVLANMGDTIILHNDPPHPLRIPLCVTGLFEIRDNPEHTVRTIEKMCAAWQENLRRQAERDHIERPLVVTHDDDGVWYLELPWAVNGLAWTFTDRYVITCWSPEALREYLERAPDTIGRRIAK
ncbi:MAG: hypothetical protein D6744_09400, partial [Planctomycetota bacterium]